MNLCSLTNPNWSRAQNKCQFGLLDVPCVTQLMKLCNRGKLLSTLDENPHRTPWFRWIRIWYGRSIRLVDADCTPWYDGLDSYLRCGNHLSNNSCSVVNGLKSVVTIIKWLSSHEYRCCCRRQSSLSVDGGIVSPLKALITTFESSARVQACVRACMRMSTRMWVLITVQGLEGARVYKFN